VGEEEMMGRRGCRKTLAVVLTAAALTGTVGADLGTAQENLVRVEGRVQWIAGGTMVVAPYGTVVAPAGTSAINIDLSRVDQGEYKGLSAGDSVVVTGTVTTARDRVIARSVERPEGAAASP
jgi:hypothetical protein